MERNGDIEWYRFLAASLVVISHLKYFGIITSVGKWGGYTVELFFLMTGYFTANHFNNTTDFDAEKIVSYCFKKMMKLVPLTSVATISMHLLTAVQQLYSDGSLQRYWETFKTLPFDLLLITQFYINRPTCPTLWYLSVLLLVLPIFCIIACSKHRYKFYIISFFLLMLYVGGLMDLKIGQWGDVLKGFVFVLSGGGIFLISSIIKDNTHINQILLYSFEKLFLYSGFAILLFFELDYKFLILLWVLGLLAAFSHKSMCCLGSIKRFLGRLSIPIYILHWPLGIVIALLLRRYNNAIKLSGYVLLICFVLFVYYLKDSIKRKKGRNNEYKEIAIKE